MISKQRPMFFFSTKYKIEGSRKRKCFLKIGCGKKFLTDSNEEVRLTAENLRALFWSPDSHNLKALI